MGGTKSTLREDLEELKKQNKKVTSFMDEMRMLKMGMPPHKNEQVERNSTRIEENSLVIEQLNEYLDFMFLFKSVSDNISI